jgi:nucleotide-binding universal stress UspA family protein
MYRKIVVPLDGSAAAECVLSHMSFVAGKGSEIVLVRVVAKPGYDFMLRDSQLSACLDDEFSKEAFDYLKEKARSLSITGATVTTCVLPEQGPIAVIILEFAKRAKADLIAISAHGKTGLIGRLVGSVADRIVHHGGIPVLLVHP